MSWIENKEVQLIINNNTVDLIEVRSEQNGSTPGAYIVQNGLVAGASYLITATGRNLGTSQVRLWIGDYNKTTLSFDPKNIITGDCTIPSTISVTWINSTNLTRAKVGFLFVNPRSGDLYIIDSYTFVKV